MGDVLACNTDSTLPFPPATESTAHATRSAHCPCSTSPCPGAYALASLLARSTGRFPLGLPARGWRGLWGSCFYLPPSLKKSRYQSVDSAARPTDPFTVNCHCLNEANDCDRLNEADARCVAGEGDACPGTNSNPGQDER